MICQIYFCIFCETNTCILESITLDIQGCCECCIYVEIEEQYLRKAKSKLLNKYKSPEYLDKYNDPVDVCESLIQTSTGSMV